MRPPRETHLLSVLGTAKTNTGRDHESGHCRDEKHLDVRGSIHKHFVHVHSAHTAAPLRAEYGQNK